MNKLKKFEKLVSALPGPGDIASLHGALWPAARLGKEAGLSADEVVNRLCDGVTATGRDPRTRLRDIERTVHNAFQGTEILCRVRASAAVQELFEEGFERIARKGEGIAKYDLWEMSNPRPGDDPGGDGILFVQTLYGAEDHLCLGKDCTATAVKPRNCWLDDLRHNGNRHAQFIVNPFSGKEFPLANGKLSKRCDAAVARWPYVLAEFDPPKGSDLFPLPQQLAFWAAVPLPIAALIYSGNKSIHAIVALGDEITSKNDWDRIVKGQLFRNLLSPLGADASTANPSRFSRLPGHVRSDTGREQRLLYLCSQPKHGGIIGTCDFRNQTP
jgi:hypothetical protein